MIQNFRRLGRGLVPVLLGLALGAGCQQRPQTPAPPGIEPAETSPFKQRPKLAQQNPSTLLAAGTLPLVYVFENGGNLRIRNASTRQVLLQTQAPAGSLVSVSAIGGVMVGREKLLRGPLPVEDRYEIWWDAEP